MVKVAAASAANLDFTSFNAGEIGKEIQGRTSLEKYSATAAILENLWPLPEGPMQFRPGMQFYSELGGLTYLRRWIFSITQKHLMAFSDMELRIVQDGGILARPPVSSTVTAGTFTTLTGWTNFSAGGGAATIVSNMLNLASDGTSVAGVRQQVTTSNAGELHALRIVVERGPVKFKVGSASGGDQYISTTELRKGVHSLGFVPSGSYWIEIWSTERRAMKVDECTVEASGDLVLPTPWLASTYTSLRFEQSKDVLFVASGLGNKKRIERRSANSWSIVNTDEKDGPFLDPNVDPSITITPSGTSGNRTLTASVGLFKAGHVGALWKLTHAGQRVSQALNGANQFSDPIKVTGVGDEARDFTVRLTGTMDDETEVTLQKSYGDTTSWQDVDDFDGDDLNQNFDIYEEEDDNQIVYYRIGIKAGEYGGTGTTTATLTYSGGSTDGVCRIVGFTSVTVVDVEILSNFASTDATINWAEGSWSDVQGWPKGIGLYDGRLWNGYADEFWGSGSDLYESQRLGDQPADAINRLIATGQVAQIQSIVPLKRLIMLTDGGEACVKSSDFDEPLTPTNLSVRDVASFGAADVAPYKVDNKGIYVDRSALHIMELSYSVDAQDYVAVPLTRLHKNIGRPGITKVVMTRRPETRMFMRRSDGRVLTKLYDPGENVLGWAHMITARGDKIIDVEVLPGAPGEGEDEVWFTVQRRLANSNEYYLEKLGNFYYTTLAEASCADSFVRTDGPVCNAVTFNGASYIHRNAALTGNADGKAGLISFWANLAGTDNAEMVLLATGDGRLVVKRTTTGKWQIIGKNASDTTILSMTSTSSYGNASGWRHVAFAWDLATGFGQLRVDGADDKAAGSTLTDDTLDYTSTDTYIGAAAAGTAKLYADVAQLYINFAASLDLTVASNMAKLYADNGMPTQLGDTGAGPTGSQPLVLLNGDEAGFVTNAGSGGNFVVSTGLLYDAEDPPAPRLASTSSVFTGYDHLEGRAVVVWADGVSLGAMTVASGALDIGTQAAQLMVGLAYTGRYQSSKLALSSQLGTSLAQRQQNLHINLLLIDSDVEIEYGSNFTLMDRVSTTALSVYTDGLDDNGEVVEGALISGITEQLVMPGDMNRDPRLCIRCASPNPATVQGYVLAERLVEST